MWTPTGLASEFHRYRGRIWRIVEGQHRISTNRLADPEDQGRLEDLIEEVKPDLPPETEGLHFLLAACFRYGYPKESRFRRADERPGIFYGAEHEETVLAEIAWWRLDFFSRSPGVELPSGQSEHTSFTVEVAFDRLIDLTAEPFLADRDKWISEDYKDCHALADAARVANAEAIRYESSRQRDGKGRNLAVLHPRCFCGSPRVEMTWHFRYESGDLVATSAFPDNRSFRFGRGTRLRSM
ncbi:RES family NAD+ phosphorylase [Pseudokordiimonas caeni]|uniref:RES family NAD+ phosphorylase n=1 Tax=Pseudokordiimonas caeni TaxID=2997908 RepID=UPI002810EC55|nr:RES family NAD+ phosphorylase [Pseudokordiimonas caeni]